MSTLPAFASLDALLVRLGAEDMDEGDLARAQAALDDTSNVIRARAGSAADAWVDDDIPPIVTTVCLQAARRSFENPDGYRSETIDGWSYALAGETGFGIDLTAEEGKLIDKAAGLGTGLWSLPITRGPLEAQRCDRGNPTMLPTSSGDDIIFANEDGRGY